MKVKKKTKRLQFTVDEDLYNDFKNIGNGASFADTLRAFIAILKKYNEAPFGVNKK